MIGVVAGSASGRSAAETLVAAWPEETRLVEAGRAADALRDAVARCEAVVAFMPVGAVAQALVGHPPTGVPVVCVDESMRFAFALLGEHRGAYRLAHRLNPVLGCVPVSTATGTENDTVSLAGYGADLGFTVHDPALLPHVEAAVLAGEPVGLEGADGWPLPALPPNVGTHDAPATGILVTDRAGLDCMCHEGWFGNRLVYRPPSLVVGVGACAGAGAGEIAELVNATLSRATLAPESVRCLATVEVKADEPGIRAFAEERGWRVIAHPADVLARVTVPNPTDAARAGVGTPSVAEAAALWTARSLGRDGALVAEKRKSAHVTAAVARLAPKGRLTVVGLGPGDRDLITARARAALRRASLVITDAPVADLVRPGTLVLPEEALDLALEEAMRGRAVALARPGDGSWATAVSTDAFTLEKVPGITGDARFAPHSCDPVLPPRDDA
ncbi:cobalamin biosynthesis protein [Actinomadura kijaniata]|uniref:cobalamin biosynthesis protein n=1 Tax=Actinomadura kijaniata TaxID=46161 RepID=UPI000829F210|nr:cobalamin biosynthesis protein [Actinomadura kijaniata]